MLAVDVGAAAALVRPGGDRTPRAVRDHPESELVAPGQAERKPVGRPEGVQRPRCQHVLRVEVEAAAAIVAPPDDGAPRAVGDDDRVRLVMRGQAEGPSVDRPSGIHRPRGQDVLGVVVGAHGRDLLPRDDCTTGAVGGHVGGLLAARVGRDGRSARQPLLRSRVAAGQARFSRCRGPRPSRPPLRPARGPSRPRPSTRAPHPRSRPEAAAPERRTP